MSSPPQPPPSMERRRNGSSIGIGGFDEAADEAHELETQLHPAQQVKHFVKQVRARKTDKCDELDNEQINSENCLFTPTQLQKRQQQVHRLQQTQPPQRQNNNRVDRRAMYEDLNDDIEVYDYNEDGDDDDIVDHRQREEYCYSSGNNNEDEEVEIDDEEELDDEEEDYMRLDTIVEEDESVGGTGASTGATIATSTSTKTTTNDSLNPMIGSVAQGSASNRLHLLPNGSCKLRPTVALQAHDTVEASQEPTSLQFQQQQQQPSSHQSLESLRQVDPRATGAAPAGDNNNPDANAIGPHRVSCANSCAVVEDKSCDAQPSSVATSIGTATSESSSANSTTTTTSNAATTTTRSHQIKSNAMQQQQQQVPLPSTNRLISEHQVRQQQTLFKALAERERLLDELNPSERRKASDLMSFSALTLARKRRSQQHQHQSRSQNHAAKQLLQQQQQQQDLCDSNNTSNTSQRRGGGGVPLSSVDLSSMPDRMLDELLGHIASASSGSSCSSSPASPERSSTKSSAVSKSSSAASSCSSSLHESSSGSDDDDDDNASRLRTQSDLTGSKRDLSPARELARIDAASSNRAALMPNVIGVHGDDVCIGSSSTPMSAKTRRSQQSTSCRSDAAKSTRNLNDEDEDESQPRRRKSSLAVAAGGSQSASAQASGDDAPVSMDARVDASGASSLSSVELMQQQQQHLLMQKSNSQPSQPQTVETVLGRMLDAINGVVAGSAAPAAAQSASFAEPPAVPAENLNEMLERGFVHLERLLNCSLAAPTTTTTTTMSGRTHPSDLAVGSPETPSGKTAAPTTTQVNAAAHQNSVSLSKDSDYGSDTQSADCLSSHCNAIESAAAAQSANSQSQTLSPIAIELSLKLAESLRQLAQQQQTMRSQQQQQVVARLQNCAASTSTSTSPDATGCAPDLTAQKQPVASKTTPTAAATTIKRAPMKTVVQINSSSNAADSTNLTTTTTSRSGTPTTVGGIVRNMTQPSIGGGVGGGANIAPQSSAVFKTCVSIGGAADSSSTAARISSTSTASLSNSRQQERRATSATSAREDDDCCQKQQVDDSEQQVDGEAILATQQSQTQAGTKNGQRNSVVVVEDQERVVGAQQQQVVIGGLRRHRSTRRSLRNSMRRQQAATGNNSSSSSTLQAPTGATGASRPGSPLPRTIASAAASMQQVTQSSHVTSMAMPTTTTTTTTTTPPTMARNLSALSDATANKSNENADEKNGKRERRLQRALVLAQKYNYSPARLAASKLNEQLAAGHTQTFSHMVDATATGRNLQTVRQEIQSASRSFAGQIELNISYSAKSGSLTVHVIRCAQLQRNPTAQKQQRRCNPYVKLYLLPDRSKSGKRKSAARKNTLEPEFDEQFTFGPLQLAEFDQKLLWISVLHKADRLAAMSRNELIGELLLPLAQVRHQLLTSDLCDSTSARVYALSAPLRMAAMQQQQQTAPPVAPATAQTAKPAKSSTTTNAPQDANGSNQQADLIQPTTTTTTTDAQRLFDKLAELERKAARLSTCAMMAAPPSGLRPTDLATSFGRLSDSTAASSATNAPPTSMNVVLGADSDESHPNGSSSASPLISGQLFVALKFVPENTGETLARRSDRMEGTLCVLIKEARNIGGFEAPPALLVGRNPIDKTNSKQPIAQPTGPLPNPFCKCYLLNSNGARIARQRTPQAKRTSNPRWDFECKFNHVKLSHLQAQAIEIHLLSRDSILVKSSQESLGSIRLCSSTSTSTSTTAEALCSERESRLWAQMLARPNIWVYGELPLSHLRPLIAATTADDSVASGDRVQAAT